MDKEEGGRRGMGLTSILTIVFVIAKILGFIEWSWWLVFIPIYGRLGAVLFIFLVAGILTLIDHKNGSL